PTSPSVLPAPLKTETQTHECPQTISCFQRLGIRGAKVVCLPISDSPGLCVGVGVCVACVCWCVCVWSVWGGARRALSSRSCAWCVCVCVWWVWVCVCVCVCGVCVWCVCVC